MSAAHLNMSLSNHQPWSSNDRYAAITDRSGCSHEQQQSTAHQTLSIAAQQTATGRAEPCSTRALAVANSRKRACLRLRLARRKFCPIGNPHGRQSPVDDVDCPEHYSSVLEFQKACNTPGNASICLTTASSSSASTEVAWSTISISVSLGPKACFSTERAG